MIYFGTAALIFGVHSLRIRGTVRVLPEAVQTPWPSRPKGTHEDGVIAGRGRCTPACTSLKGLSTLSRGFHKHCV